MFKANFMQGFSWGCSLILVAAGLACVEVEETSEQPGVDTTEITAGTVTLPSGGAGAQEQLNSSPRNSEWVDVQAGEGDTVRARLTYSERSDPAPVVVVIHENRGLSVWVQAVADQLAAEGFITIAPDLLSGKGPGGGGTDSVDPDRARELIGELQWEEIVRRVTAVAEYAASLPTARPQVGIVGFCWGGRTTFAYAGENPNLRAAVVYYGTSPDAETVARIEAPVLGLYGGTDTRVNATIEPARQEMERLGKRYEIEIYEEAGGASHAFLRRQDELEGANLQAAEDAWLRTVRFLKEELEPKIPD